MDPAFRTSGQANAVTFATKGISPPSSLYVRRDDSLFISMLTNLAAGDTVTFFGRLLQASPELSGQPGEQPPQMPQAPSDAQTQSLKIINTQLSVATPINLTQQVALSEGYLLNMGAIATNAATRGQTYVEVAIIRGPTNGPAYFMPLFADYVTSGIVNGWPGGRVISPVESNGWLHSVQQANPAAGADWTMTVPASRRRRVNSFSAIFAAAVAVANRNVQVIVDDGANTVWEDDLNASITSGQTVTVACTGTNVPTGVVATILHAVIPPGLIMPAGWRLRTTTANINGADQWSAIWLNVEDWVDA